MDELKIKVTLRGDHATRLRVSLPPGLTIRASGDNITAQYVSGLGPTTYADPTDGSALVEVENWDDDADQPETAPHLVIPWLAAAALVAKHTPDNHKDRMTMARCLAGGLLRGWKARPWMRKCPPSTLKTLQGWSSISGRAWSIVPGMSRPGRRPLWTRL